MTDTGTGARSDERAPARQLLSVALTKYPHVAPLIDGTVRPATADLELGSRPDSILKVFRSMSRHLTWDMSELGLPTAFAAHTFGTPMSAIPVFVTRRFDHEDVWYDQRAGLGGAAELAGRRIAIRSPFVADTVWAIGLLMDEYGVHPDDVTWVVTGDEHISAAVLPPNVELRFGADPAGMLEAGEVAGMVGRYGGAAAGIVPAFTDPEAVKQRLIAAWGAITIHHVIVIADRVLQADPELPSDLYRAFCDAKQPFLDDLAAGRDVLGGYHDSTQGTVHDYGVETTDQLVRPDPMPYGLARNAEMLSAFVRYSKVLKLVPESVAVEELFADVDEAGRS